MNHETLSDIKFWTKVVYANALIECINISRFLIKINIKNWLVLQLRHEALSAILNH